jgi:hypothetical protein
MSQNFLQTRQHKHGWTWREKRNGVVIKSCCDVIMGTDQRHFKLMKIINPPSYDSDHYAVVATIWAATMREQKNYIQGRKQFPEVFDSSLLMELVDTTFSNLLKFKIVDDKRRLHERSEWISEAMWNLIEKRSRFMKTGQASMRKRRQLKNKLHPHYVKID